MEALLKSLAQTRQRETFFPMLLGVLSGAVTLLFGYLGFITVENVFPESWGSIWKQWDSSHYLTIAAEGYASAEFLICFFPLYPLCIRLASFVFPDPLAGALLISNVAFIGGIYFLYKLIRLDFERRTAELAVLFCVCFPTAYFFHLAYAESLFFALTMGSLYQARRGRWLLAGFLGFFAALTRLPGLVLGLVLMVEYLEQRQFAFRKVRCEVIYAILPVLGFGGYLLVNYFTHGSPLHFLETFGSHFDRRLSLPFEGLKNSFLGVFLSSPTKRLTIWGENLIFFFLSTAVLVWSFRRLRRSYLVYGLSIWALTFCLNFWLSVPRFIMMFFPMYIAAALLTEKRPVWRYTVLFISVFLYTLGTIQFVRGWWAN